MTSASPFAIDPSSPDPWAAPLAALEQLFYPPVSPAVPPLFKAVGALMAAEFLLCLANVAIRWGRTGIRLYTLEGDRLIPQTAVLWCLCGAGYLASAQGQVWVAVRIYERQGSYAGLEAARALTWLFGTLQLYFQVLGLFLSTPFQPGVTCVTTTEKASTAKRRPWLIAWNRCTTLVLPAVILAAILAPGVVTETACMELFHDFESVRALATNAQQQWLQGGVLDNSTVSEFYLGVAGLDHGSCLPVVRGFYGAFLWWELAEELGTIACYLLVSHKLKRQITILRRSAARGLERLEQSERVTGPERLRDSQWSGTLNLEDVYPSYDVSAEPNGPPLPDEQALEADPTGRRQRRQAARADELSKGLRQLRWITAMALFVNTIYIGENLIIETHGTVLQTDSFWSPFLSLLALWTYAIFVGIGICILFVAALDPGRESFLGIPVNLSSDRASSDSRLSRSAPGRSTDSFAASKTTLPARPKSAMSPSVRRSSSWVDGDTRWDVFVRSAPSSAGGRDQSPERLRDERYASRETQGSANFLTDTF